MNDTFTAISRRQVAQSVLMPRLMRFFEANPGISLRI